MSAGSLRHLLLLALTRLNGHSFPFYRRCALRSVNRKAQLVVGV